MYEKNKNEIYAEKWFRRNGFQFKLLKQYISKSKYEVTKDSIKEIFELPSNITDIRKYMELFDKSFNMKIEIAKLKDQIKEVNN